jgi:hypothetical protein
MYGYEFTTVLRAYNETKSELDDLVLPVLYLDNYKDIYNTSGWYIPSPKELATLCVDGNYRVIWGNNGRTPGNATATAVNQVLSLLGESLATPLYDSYWTSSRQTKSLNSGNYVDISDNYGGVGYTGDWLKYARGVCAF